MTADAGNCDLADPAGRTPDELLRALFPRPWPQSQRCTPLAGPTARSAVSTRSSTRGHVALCSLGSARPWAVSDDDIQLDAAQLTALLHRVGSRPVLVVGQTREWRRSTRRLHHRLRATRDHDHLDRRASPTDGTSPTAADIAAVLQELAAERHATSPRHRMGRVRPHLSPSGTPSALLAGALGVGITALLWSAATPAGACANPAKSQPPLMWTTPTAIRDRPPAWTSTVTAARAVDL